MSRHYEEEDLFTQRVKVVICLEGTFEKYLKKLVSSSDVSKQFWKTRSNHLFFQIKNVYSLHYQEKFAL